MIYKMFCTSAFLFFTSPIYANSEVKALQKIIAAQTAELAKVQLQVKELQRITQSSDPVVEFKRLTCGEDLVGEKDTRNRDMCSLNTCFTACQISGGSLAPLDEYWEWTKKRGIPDWDANVWVSDIPPKAVRVNFGAQLRVNRSKSSAFLADSKQSGNLTRDIRGGLSDQPAASGCICKIR